MNGRLEGALARGCALSPVAARQELTRCAGSQFDPAIVRALLNVSIGRLRWVIDPVSWVADVPLLVRSGVAGQHRRRPDHCHGYHDP